MIIKLAPKLGHPGWAVALGLLCAGVSGNLTDRLFRQPGVLRGHVVDFFQLPHFAIFNVADMCITSAAVMIMILAVIKNVGITGEHYVRAETRAEDHAEARRWLIRRSSWSPTVWRASGSTLRSPGCSVCPGAGSPT